MSLLLEISRSTSLAAFLMSSCTWCLASAFAAPSLLLILSAWKLARMKRAGQPSWDEQREELRLAIEKGQLELYLQPQLERGAVVGAEALSRWNHPKRGVLLPAEFLPLAEESGLIHSLGDWVLDAACRQIVAWSLDPLTRPLTLSVNISPNQFRNPDFVEKLLDMIERTGADPRHLKLEIPESTLLDHSDEVIAKMEVLRTYGLKFSLDDFGTGYSSLSSLKKLPVDQLKIDRSFVGEMMNEPNSAAIVQAVTFLARAMGKQVIAEGVESEEQCQLLAELGCQSYQGFLFSTPVPTAQFEQFFLNWKRGDGDSRVVSNLYSIIYKENQGLSKEHQAS